MSAPRAPKRVVTAVCLVLTVSAGLLVHLRGAELGATAQDIAGDALWAAMMVWWVALLLPLRATTLGHLVLGSDFDARDLAAYTLGVVVAVALERLAREREPLL